MSFCSPSAMKSVESSLQLHSSVNFKASPSSITGWTSFSSSGCSSYEVRGYELGGQIKDERQTSLYLSVITFFSANHCFSANTSVGQVFTCGQPGHRKGGSNVDAFHSAHVTTNSRIFALLQDGRSGSPAAHFRSINLCPSTSLFLCSAHSLLPKQSSNVK